jgi:hypothetical protein
MAQYVLTRINYAHHIIGTQPIEAATDGEACSKAIRFAKENAWLRYELRQLERLVICQKLNSAK